MDYRYASGRWWVRRTPVHLRRVGAAEPPTSDTESAASHLDRCLARSRADGQTGVIIVNPFAHRDTNPRALTAAADPVGPADDDALRAPTHAGARTVAAGGPAQPARPFDQGRCAA